MSCSEIHFDLKDDQSRKLLISFIECLALEDYEVIDASLKNWAIFDESYSDFGLLNQRYMWTDFQIEIIGTSYPAKNVDEYPMEDCVL